MSDEDRTPRPAPGPDLPGLLRRARELRAPAASGRLQHAVALGLLEHGDAAWIRAAAGLLDVLGAQLDQDPDSHLYYSTACAHEAHWACLGVCKFGDEPCLCPCPHPGRNDPAERLRRRLEGCVSAYTAQTGERAPDEDATTVAQELLALVLARWPAPPR